MWWYPRWTGKRAHPLPSSRHKLRGCNERFCSFYVLESLKRKFILTTSLCLQQLFWKVWQNFKKNCILFTLWEVWKQAYRSVITWLILAMGRGVVAANFVIGLRIRKKLRWSFFHWLIHSQRFSSYPNNDNLEVDWLLLTQSVCDTIQSLCEYFMTYSTLMVDMFLKRTRGVLPTVAYTRKLRRKRKPYLGFRYIKEWGFTGWSIWKGREIYHFGLSKGPKA